MVSSMLTDLQVKILKVIAEMNEKGEKPSITDIARMTRHTYDCVLKNIRYLEDKHLITNKSFGWKASLHITKKGEELLKLIIRIEEMLR